MDDKNNDRPQYPATSRPAGHRQVAEGPVPGHEAFLSKIASSLIARSCVLADTPRRLDREQASLLQKQSEAVLAGNKKRRRCRSHRRLNLEGVCTT